MCEEGETQVLHFVQDDNNFNCFWASRRDFDGGGEYSSRRQNDSR